MKVIVKVMMKEELDEESTSTVIVAAPVQNQNRKEMREKECSAPFL